MKRTLVYAALFFAIAIALNARAAIVYSKQSGPWSDPSTWDAHVPAAGDSVQIRSAHRVVYDVASDAVIRAVHVAGALSFANDRDTKLTVGVLNITPGDAFVEDSAMNCHADATPKASATVPTLEIGTADAPIPANHTATIRLAYVDGLDKDSYPALVTCGGRIDLHGAPMNRTWVKLGFTAEVGEDRVFLNEPVTGWKPGDRVLITATSRQIIYTDTYTKSVADAPRSEERVIKSIDTHHGKMRLQLDRPLKFNHRGDGNYRGEVANLSRNVVIESADPKGVRGHTMINADTFASISYAEFRELGKKGVLGRYPLHFHLMRDSGRGSSVIGASIHNSDNHLITIHGTQYLVVRDCVGYRSLGHGIFLEDGTESFNILDRNLVVQALRSDPLPKSFLPFDANDGAAFWWANSRNSFTRNVAVECDQYGFRFEVVKNDKFDPAISVPQPDGATKRTDLRTIPFIRFDENETHAQRRFGINLGGIASHRGYSDNDPKYKIQTEDVDSVGPDKRHPFVLTHSRQWDCQWPFHAGSPMVIVDGMDIFDCEYGLWRSVTTNHQYHDLTFNQIRSHTIFFPRTGGTPDLQTDQEPSGDPKDDAPPISIITDIAQHGDHVVVTGFSSDNGTIARVVVNDVPAHSVDENFLAWQATLPLSDVRGTITARAEDSAGNIEARPHVMAWKPSRTPATQSYTSAH
jgi:hypothetical protein